MNRAIRPLNKKLVRQIARHIKAHPEQYDQSMYGPHSTHMKECRTSCCIAGWACFLSDGSTPQTHRAQEERARVLLGLNYEEAHYLFHYTWPTAWLPEPPAQGTPTSFAPNADQAAAILHRIVDEEIPL